MGLIRFILAIAVVLCHTTTINGFSPVSGNTAVQCFYIISGFYMSLVLNEKYIGKNSLETFYTNRALKIYPIYWFVLIASLLWSFMVYKLGYPGVLKQYADNSPLATSTTVYLALSNIFIIGLDWIFLFGLKDGKMFFTKDFNSSKPALYTFAFNSIAWTVGVELMFYFIAPFILKKGKIIILFVLFIGLTIKVTLGHFGLVHAPWDYMFFPTQLPFFMAGGLSYHLYKSVRLSKPWIICVAIFFLLFILFYYQLPSSPWKEICFFTVTTFSIPQMFELTKNLKIDRLLGDLSYPIYISQSLVIMVTAPKIFPKPFGWGVTAVCLCVIISIICHQFISKPIERRRRRKIMQMTEELRPI